MALAVAEFQGALAELADRLGVRIGQLLSNLDRLDRAEQFAFLASAYPELADPYLRASGELTAQWYAEQPAPGSLYVPEPADLPPTDQLAASARWALAQDVVSTALMGSATRAIFAESRRTVVNNAEQEGVRWARHASANACGFCRMLATRQAVYLSEARASKSHDYCHCIAVPDRDGKYTPASYVAQWERDYRAARADGARSAGEIATAMDKAAAARRATRQSPATAAGAGGGKPPKPPTRSGGAAMAGGGDRWSEGERARRQAALGMNTHGEALERHEIEFMEAFQAAGHRAEWIPRDRTTFKPTNDFIWIDNGGLPVELKSTSGKYSSIRSHLHRAIVRGKAQDVVKENFIIDLGGRPLSPKLRSQLGQYNSRNPLHPVARLWVMSRGVIEQIDLA